MPGINAIDEIPVTMPGINAIKGIKVPVISAIYGDNNRDNWN